MKLIDQRLERAEEIRPVKQLLNDLVEAIPGTSYCHYDRSSKELDAYFSKYSNADEFMESGDPFPFEIFSAESDLDTLIIPSKENGVRTPDEIYKFIFDRRDDIPEYSPLFIVDHKSLKTGITNKRNRSNMINVYRDGVWVPERQPVGAVETMHVDLIDMVLRLDNVRKEALNIDPVELRRDKEKGAEEIRRVIKETRVVYVRLKDLMTYRGNTVYFDVCKDIDKVLSELDKFKENRAYRLDLVTIHDDGQIVNEFLNLKNTAENALEIFYQNLDGIKTEFKIYGSRLYQKGFVDPLLAELRRTSSPNAALES